MESLTRGLDRGTKPGAEAIGGIGYPRRQRVGGGVKQSRMGNVLPKLSHSIAVCVDYARAAPLVPLVAPLPIVNPPRERVPQHNTLKGAAGLVDAGVS